MNQIKEITPGSIAEEMDIEVGDTLLSVNGREVKDIMDFIYLCHDAYIEVDIQKPNGEIWTLEIDKEYDEPLGLDFTNPIIDHARRCSNNCVFCFIDQLPKGMREPLYFKDDDSRLSFLQGNFVTLTNLKDDDLKRIVEYGISPINVSVHTTDPDLRVKMLGNKFAGQIMTRLEYLISGGITINAQIVLCPSYNDGPALEKTLLDLMTFYPKLESVAIVPIGLTKYREGLPDMRPVGFSEACETLDLLGNFQAMALKKIGTRFAFAADEFYIQAKRPFPDDDAYEGYIQLEDGIGMVRKLESEVKDALQVIQSTASDRRQVLIVTGMAAKPYLEEIVSHITHQYETIECRIQGIENTFFGPRITVAGLLTGFDLKSQIKLDSNDTCVLLPDSMFRSGETILLDDVFLKDLQDYFKVPFYKVPVDGESLVAYILNGGTNE